MSGQPDEQPIADDPPDLGYGLIVLADVNAVGAALEREIGAIVHDEQRTVLVAERAQRLPGGNDLLVARMLLAKLDDVDAATQRGGHHVDRSGVDYQVKARITQ